MSKLDPLGAGLLRGVIWLLGRLDVQTSSNLCAAITRNIGPMLPVNRVGDANLRLALPELDATARRRVLREVWDNLGRVVGELPHLPELEETASGPGYEVVGAETLAMLRNDPGPALLVGAHLSNWELLPVAAARAGLRFGGFYRAASNVAVDALILELREKAARRKLPSFPKGAAGGRQAVAHLMKHGHLGLLFDQKLNNGIAVKLFGHDAMTAPAAAAFALRYKAHLVAVRVQRIGPVRYRITVEPPLPHPTEGTTNEKIATLTRALNQQLETWVRDDPGQWLWLHRRWPKSASQPLVSK